MKLAEVLCHLHEEELGAYVEESPEGIYIDLNAWAVRHSVKVKKPLQAYKFPAIGAVGYKEEKKCISGENIADSGAQSHPAGTS
jgi:hypothetical protein